MPNQLLDLPIQLINCLPEANKLCLYGVTRSDSFLMSISYITNKDFLFYDNRGQKDDHIKDKKMELAVCLNDYFKENKYRLIGGNRSNMENQLINENTVNDIIRWYIADYYKVNIVMINLVNQTYQLASLWNPKYPIVIMVMEDDIYLPVLHSQSDNIFPISVLDKIKTCFKLQQNPLIAKYEKK